MMNSTQFLYMQTQSDSGYGWLVLSIGCLVFTAVFAQQRLHINLPFPTLTLPSVRLPHVLFVGFILRSISLFQFPWYDESFTARMASLPLDKLPGAIMGDVHPPLFYLLEWVLYHLGITSPAGMRLLPLVFGLVSIALVYRLAVALGMKEAAIGAALIVALLPNAMYYSVEARQYSLLAMLVLGAWICLMEGRKRLFVLCAGLLVWTHNIGVIYLAIACLIALLKWRDLRPVMAAGLINALWLPVLVIQARDVADGFWLQSIGWYDLLEPLVGTTVLTVAKGFVIPLYLAAITLSLYSFWAARRWLVRAYPLVLLVFGVPILLGLVSWLWTPVYLMRSMLPVGIGLTIFWASAAAHNRWLQLPLVAMMLIAGLGFMHYERTRDYPLVLSRCEGADSALFIDVPSAVLGSRYITLDWRLWEGANDLNQTLTDETKAALNLVQGDIRQMNGYVCVVAEHNPFISTAEQSYLSYLLTHYPHRDYRVMYTPVYGFGVYIIDTGLHE